MLAFCRLLVTLLFPINIVSGLSRQTRWVVVLTLVRARTVNLSSNRVLQWPGAVTAVKGSRARARAVTVVLLTSRVLA